MLGGDGLLKFLRGFLSHLTVKWLGSTDVRDRESPNTGVGEEQRRENLSGLHHKQAFQTPPVLVHPPSAKLLQLGL